jgi:hypothetical protein
MTPKHPEPADGADTTLKPVTIRLTEADIEAWKRITRRRYPLDTQRMSQVIRDLIREEDAKGATGK